MSKNKKLLKASNFIAISICFVVSLLMIQSQYDVFKANIGFAQNTGVEELLIQNGFEDNTYGEPADEIEYFHGADLTMTNPNDWDEFENHSDIGYVKIQYQGGDVSERFARIIDDPTTTDENQILHYWLKEPNTGDSGRIQMNFYENYNTEIDEFYISVRMYLHPSFQELIDGDFSFSWMTLFEFWNDAEWRDHLDPNEPITPFRMNISMDKRDDAPGTPLYFDVSGDVKNSSWDEIWEVKDEYHPVPIGQWFTAEVYVKEGDKNNGRFYFAITPDGEHKKVIADVHDYTYHPDDQNPDGFVDLNPMKLYTSPEVLDFMDPTGEVLQVYWDDFKFWKNKQPASAVCPD